jgi:hypothetical protein
MTANASRSFTEWLTDNSYCISSVSSPSRDSHVVRIYRNDAQRRVMHQRVAALRKSDGVTPVAFLNAVLKC